MYEIFGDFVEMGETQEYMILSFSSSALPIQERWRNNSLSADFLADYWGTFFPAQSDSPRHERSAVRDAVSFIANELLENAVKFSYRPEFTIKIALYLSEDELRFYVSNSINPQSIGKFQDFIREILTEDPNDLYLRQLEKNADENNSDESHLGFLTIVNDYNTNIAWKFETVQPELVIVTTMVKLGVVRSHSY